MVPRQSRILLVRKAASLSKSLPEPPADTKRMAKREISGFGVTESH